MINGIALSTGLPFVLGPAVDLITRRLPIVDRDIPRRREQLPSGQ